MKAEGERMKAEGTKDLKQRTKEFALEVILVV